MEKLNNEALFKISYGLFVLTAREGEKDNGCIINVCQMVTDNPKQVMICVNKKNLTHDMILRTGRFNVSVLTQHAPFKVFEHFGFQSGHDTDKFAHCEVTLRADNGIRYLPRFANAYLSGVINHAVDLGTHTLFIANVDEAATLNSDPSLTYEYYQQHIKPQPVIPTEGDGKGKWVCQTCGYVYEGDEMPDDFICPWCKHGKSDFIKTN